MACTGAGSYDEQRLAKKRYKRKMENRFKTNFIALWEKYGEVVEVNGVRCFSLYRIDGDGEAQRKMSRRLQQPKLYEDVDDKHFDWVKLYFNLGKLKEISDDDVDAFFEHYKNEAHGRGADKLHYKLADVTNPNDYGYYETTKAVTEHWFERKIVTVTQDEDGNDVETVTWEKIEDDEFLEELSWEIADLALDSAVWFDPDTLQPITEIVYDEELDEAALDAKIDALRATEPYIGTYGEQSAIYKVRTIGDKIEAYTLEQSVGGNILDELEYVQYWGDEGTYYLSIDAAKKMRGDVFMNLVIKTLDFRTKLKAKYKWRKRLLGLLSVVAAGVALFFGQPYVAASIMASYIGSVSNSQAIKILSTVMMIAAGPAGAGFSAMSASEAVNLIMNVAALYFAMQNDMHTPAEPTEDADTDQMLFYKTPYDIYDDIYCFDDLISVEAAS